MKLPEIRGGKINNNWLLLGLAILLGVGASLLGHSILKKRMAEIDEAANKGKEFVRVVVAVRDMSVGEALTKSDVAAREVPKEFVHSNAIRPNEFGQIERQRLAFPVRRGEVLLPSMMNGQGNTVFSATLKPGTRALTFDVDAINSISGMLRPGDRIDLVYSTKYKDKNARSSNADKDLTFPLLSNVTVLATGQIVRNDAKGTGTDYSTITVELDPKDAQKIIVAKANGKLTAVLRNPDDEMANVAGLTTAQELVKDVLPAAQVKPKGVIRRAVEYILGG